MTRTPKPMTLDAFRELVRGGHVIVDAVRGDQVHVTVDHGRASTLLWVPSSWMQDPAVAPRLRLREERTA